MCLPLKKRIYDTLMEEGEHTAMWLHRFLEVDLRAVTGALVSLRKDGKVLHKGGPRQSDPAVWSVNPRWYPIKSNRRCRK